MPLERGTRLGPYEVDGMIGSGGMADVYRARDVRLGREVALKVLPHDAASADGLARFEREARTASALNHPHIVTIYEAGEADAGGQRLQFIAMELIHGSTLRQRLGVDDRETLLRYLADVAGALAKAHDAGVVHRDLKPENVMISDDGFVKVLDFGVARWHPHVEAARDRITRDGLTVGTTGYMAPEQVRGVRDVDHRADVFRPRLHAVRDRRGPPPVRDGDRPRHVQPDPAPRPAAAA